MSEPSTPLDLAAFSEHEHADCPVCQYALRPMDAAGETWPVVHLPGLDAWLRRIEADDAREGRS